MEALGLDRNLGALAYGLPAPSACNHHVDHRPPASLRSWRRKLPRGVRWLGLSPGTRERSVEDAGGRQLGGSPAVRPPIRALRQLAWLFPRRGGFSRATYDDGSGAMARR